MPLIDPGLIKKARAAIEKRALILEPVAGSMIGAGLAPHGQAGRGALRGAGVGLTTGLGIPIGGLLGLGSGVAGGGALGGLVGGGGNLIAQLVRGGHVDPHELADYAGQGAGIGAFGGGIAGTVGGQIAGGIKGYQFGKRHIWDQPWPRDRELPHGTSGADNDDEDGHGKAASYATRLGVLAARLTRK